MATKNRIKFEKLTAAIWDYKTSPKPWGQCTLWIPLCLLMSTETDTPVKCCTATVPSSLHPFLHLFFGRMGPVHSFPFCSFNPCVSTYLFIIVDMIISLHSNGHWIMTFHKDLLNRVLGTEVVRTKGYLRGGGGNKFPSLIPDWKLLWIYYCTNCTDLNMWAMETHCNITTTLKAKMKAHCLLVKSKLILSCHYCSVNIIVLKLSKDCEVVLCQCWILKFIVLDNKPHSPGPNDFQRLIDSLMK